MNHQHIASGAFPAYSVGTGDQDLEMESGAPQEYFQRIGEQNAFDPHDLFDYRKYYDDDTPDLTSGATSEPPTETVSPVLRPIRNSNIQSDGMPWPAPQWNSDDQLNDLRTDPFCLDPDDPDEDRSVSPSMNGILPKKTQPHMVPIQPYRHQVEAPPLGAVRPNTNGSNSNPQIPLTQTPTGTPSKQQGTRSKMKYDPAKKQEVSLTRKNGSCIHCRILRVKASTIFSAFGL